MRFSMHHLGRLCIVAGATFFGLPTPILFARAPQQADLFSYPAHAPARWSTGPEILRAWAVDLDTAWLDRCGPGSRLELSLPRGEALGGVVEQRVVNPTGSVSIVGRSLTPAGHFAFVVRDGFAVGILRLPSIGTYRLRSNGAETTLQELNPAGFSGCGTPDRPVRHVRPLPPPGLTAPVGSPPVFHVAVFYTDLARSTAGGTASIEAEIELSILETNTAYQDSGVVPRCQLAYMGEVTYDEVGTSSEHVERLQNPSDGVLDSVHGIRDDVGADFVSLFMKDPGGICGRAFNIFGTESEAFHTVHWDCAASNFSFAHELGHNQGCRHDVDTNDSPFPHSHGYNNGSTFRTIMAVGGLFVSEPRIRRFSSPERTYAGMPTGIPNESDNTRSLNDTFPIWTQFRNPEIWVDFDHDGPEQGTFDNPYDTLDEALDAAPPGYTIRIKAGSTGATPTIEAPVSLEAHGGTVTIG